MTLADGALDMMAHDADAFELSIMILGVTDGSGCIESCRPGVALADVKLLTSVTVGAATAGSGVLDGVNDEEKRDEEAASALALGFGWAEVEVASDGRVTATTRLARKGESADISTRCLSL